MTTSKNTWLRLNHHWKKGDGSAIENLLNIMIPGLIGGLIATVILALVYKNKEKKDKGVVFSYYKLSYRRKMIRTLWSIPILVILIIGISFLAELDLTQIIILAVFFFALDGIQFLYNYWKWKKLEQ
ncbi:hypothetical protein FZC79_22175 [Rossellomorea vietnamensis]|uniref:Uncharacterized protein n=1 Tax=Rossellomorea vietnamensis TaxID=218284 RepID=A0A5D4K5E1_9BACI|nr:hypothetical protein [Rossellomorea vietnamensis]TYR72587.1 hypothetical protein FZC79_22175 [Rossellomorea vietnamensis]